jgi:hypothetical protein
MPRRKTIPLKEKINLASIVRRNRCNKQGPSLKALAREKGVAPCQLRRWEKQLDSMIQQVQVLWQQGVSPHWSQIGACSH